MMKRTDNEISGLKGALLLALDSSNQHELLPSGFTISKKTIYISKKGEVSARITIREYNEE